MSRLNIRITLAVVFAVGAAATAGLVACKSAMEVKTAWTPRPIQVDGDALDWQGLPAVLLSEQHASFTLASDSERLCLLFRTRDPRWVRTIKMAGLTLYFDRKAGTGKDLFIRLKGGPSMDKIRALSPARYDSARVGHRPMPNRFEPEGIDKPPAFTCYIKDRILEKPIPLDGSEGPAAAFDTSQGMFVYEFSIPLDEGPIRYYGLGLEPGERLSVGAVWGDTDEMQRSRPDGGRGFGISGPGGEFPGGSMGGGGGPGEGPPGGMRPERPEKQEIWLKTSLAKPSDVAVSK
jgi:hypothetical protein